MPEQPTISLSKRFRELRERAGLSESEAAQQLGFTVFDLEEFEDELTTCHSPSDVREFCRVLKATPAELLGITTDAPSVSAQELVAMIHAECRKRGVTLEQFEDAVGWRLGKCVDPPERMLNEMTLDGLQWLCRELGIDWHRIMMSL